MPPHPVVAGVLEQLRAGRSVVLPGPSGAGRSRLARELATDLRAEGRVVVEVAGSDGTAAPLAPFAPLLLEAGVHPGDDPALSAYTRLPSYLRAEAAVLVVDDAHLLDSGSGVLVSQLDRAGVPLALVAEAVTALHPSVRDRLEGPGWTVLPIPPATADEILAVAAEYAGGELTAGSGAALLACAGGRPAVAVALLRAGAATRSTPGGIELELPFPITDEVLRWSVDPTGWTPEVRRAVELAAAASELPDCAADVRGIDAALADGVLVEVTGTLRFAHELDRVVVLGSMSPSVRRARAARAHELLDAAGPEWSARATLLALRAGSAVPARVLLDTAQDPRLAEAERAEVLAAVPEDDPGGLVLRAAAASAEDRLIEAEQFLDLARTGLLDGGPAPEREAWLLRLGQELGLLHAVRRGDPARAVAEVHGLIPALTDPAARATLSAELVKWRLMAGEADVDAPAPQTADADAAGAVGTAVIGAMIASLDGSRDAALAEVDRGLAALRRTAVAGPHSESLLQLSRFLALVFDGDLARARELAAGRREAAARAADPELGMWEYAAAELALHCGRLDDADVLARRAVRHLAWRDFTGLRPTADALLLAVRTRRGRPPEPAGDLDPADVKVALHLARAEADRTRDPSALVAAGRRSVGDTHTNLGVLALDEAWMLTRSPALAAELREYGDRGGVAAVLVDRVAAHQTGSAQAMTASAESLEAIGLVGRAADCWELAARLHREAGRHDSADRCVRRGILLRSASGLGRWPAAAVVLSPRETEIARLAAQRMRSREIGDQLGLSVRTVDNHLARIYRKLGVSGRDELAVALGRDNVAGVLDDRMSGTVPVPALNGETG